MTLMPVSEKQPSKKEQDGWIDDLIGALTDPIIVFPSPWQDDIPKELKEQIPLERLIMNSKVMHEGKGVPVGDLEALVYMFPRTMESPLTDEQNRLYFHCFNEAMKFMRKEVPDDLKLTKRTELNQYEMRQLDDLKRFIWDRRVKARKERARGEKLGRVPESKNESKTPISGTSKKQQAQITQPKFF